MEICTGNGLKLRSFGTPASSGPAAASGKTESGPDLVWVGLDKARNSKKSGRNSAVRIIPVEARGPCKLLQCENYAFCAGK